MSVPGNHRPRSRRPTGMKSFVLPVLAAGAAAATVFAVVAIGSSPGSGGAGGGSSDLRTLRIGSYYQELPGDSSASTKSGRYTLKGTLPTTPTKGVVWSLGRIDDGPAKVAALAKALGINGPVVHDSDGWTVTDGKAKVRVYDASGSPWGYASTTSSRGCAPIPVDGYVASGSAASCAS